VTTERSRTGQLGEELAAAYLMKHGYTIVDRNYRKKFGEIDIIARDGQILVFIEVKTRRSSAYGSPAQSVTPRKQMQISRVAEDYLARRGLFDTAARFDVVTVVLLANQQAQIEIIPAAFDAQCRS
jgi:putative endonuclease